MLVGDFPNWQLVMRMRRKLNLYGLRNIWPSPISEPVGEEEVEEVKELEEPEEEEDGLRQE